MKQCRKCKEWKELAQFNKDKNRDDGHYVYCKPCHRGDSKRYQDKHMDERKGYWSEYKDRNRERIAAREHARYIANPEPKKERERARPRYAHANITHQNSRARRAGCEGTFTLEEWHALCEQFDYHCVACKKTRKLVVDHVVPLSLGGTNFIKNIQPLCRSCNSSKRNKTTDYRIRTDPQFNPSEPHVHTYFVSGTHYAEPM